MHHGAGGALVQADGRLCWQTRALHGQEACETGSTEDSEESHEARADTAGACTCRSPQAHASDTQGTQGSPFSQLAGQAGGQGGPPHCRPYLGHLHEPGAARHSGPAGANVASVDACSTQQPLSQLNGQPKPAPAGTNKGYPNLYTSGLCQRPMRARHHTSLLTCWLPSPGQRPS